jgi:uncharacterized membrane protein
MSFFLKFFLLDFHSKQITMLLLLFSYSSFMKKFLLLLVITLVMSIATVTLAAGISTKQVDLVITKLTVIMKSNPTKFEAIVKKFYAVMDTLSDKKLEAFIPLIERVNQLVDIYNGKAVPVVVQPVKEAPVDPIMIDLKNLETFKK